MSPQTRNQHGKACHGEAPQQPLPSTLVSIAKGNNRMSAEKIRAAFVSCYGEIGETYSEINFHVRLGVFSMGWAAAMAELSQQATNTGSTPPEAGSAHA